MTCREVRDQLSEFADGDLGAESAAVVSTHVDACAVCRGVLADLVRVRDAARGLGPMAPPEHLRLEIAGQVHLERPAASAAPEPSNIRQWASLAAAVLVVTIGAYGISQWMEPAPAEPPIASSTPADSGATERVEAVVGELGVALEKAIADLQTLAKASDRPAESEIAARLLENLTVIDGAITESRMALAQDPSSVAARDSLLEALRRKVGVLQSTMSLINDLRLGDAAGANQAVSGLGKKS
jgi:hypothetical protein